MFSRLALASLLLAACGPGDSGGPSSPSPTTTTASATDRVGRWRNDIDQLATGLAERHVDPFVQVSREEFFAEAETLKEEVPSLTDPAVVVGMMELVALLGDSHTTIDTRGYSGFRQIPLELSWFADGIFVIRAAEAYREAVGMRLVGLGQASAEAAVSAVDGLAAYENESWRRVLLEGLLTIPEILSARGIAADPTEIEVEVAGAEGESLEQSVSAVPRGPTDFGTEPEPLPLYRQNAGLNYWLAHLEDTQTLYVNYRRASNMASESVASFSARVLDILDRQPIHALVIDLRLNPGGNSSLLEPLIEGLETRPRWSGGEGLYTVIGRHTFSSGVLNAFDLERRLGATLVGEPTGGKPNHFGEVRSFQLPESGLTVNYSTRFFRILEGADPASLEPDVATPLTSTDYFAGRDPALEAILDLAGR